MSGLVDLSAGAELRLDGEVWVVAALEPQWGRAVLSSALGEVRVRSFRWLVHHPDCAVVPAGSVPVAARFAGVAHDLCDLSDFRRALVALRVEHVLEVEYGYRAGDRSRALPGEPRPEYDPDSTTLAERRESKAAELDGLGATEAAMLGLDRVSARTLRRWAADWRDQGARGLIDGRWLRASPGRWSITEPVREAIFAVRAESLHRSRMDMRARERLIHQYVLEKYGPKVPVPGYHTLLAVWKEWFGPGGARQRYERSAEAVETSLARVVVHRPGQIIALDTTPLPVMVREGVFGRPANAMLTLALDLYTHSIVAFRLTLGSEGSVDVAMLLRDVMLPLPMREGWGEEMEWPYPGVPATLVAEFAGLEKVAALPFFAPETVTTDHGGPYKSRELVEAERVFGCNILPARALRPTDKHSVERTFDGIRTLLFEALPGYKGVDVADRGADVEADASITVSRMESAIATWIVRVWQNRQFGEFAPAWGPGEAHSPNTLFAASMQQGGFAVQIPKPELYYRALRRHDLTVHGRRGVKVLGLWYDGPGLDPYRTSLPPRRGAHRATVEVHSDRRDRRTAFLRDPFDVERWHELRWNGLPAHGECPAFGDKSAEALLEEVRRRGIVPERDEELLPVLLEILSDLASVEQWPGRAGRDRRTARAREITQAKAATADRAGQRTAPDAAHPADAEMAVSLDDARRTLRVMHAGAVPSAPPRLGAAARDTMFVLPDEDDETDTGGEIQ